MRGRPLPEAGNNESSLNQRYSVLSHQIPQYSTLFGHNLHYSNPNELENAVRINITTLSSPVLSLTKRVSKNGT